MFLEVANEEKRDHLTIRGEISNARMAQAWIGDAEDQLVKQAFVLIEHVLREVRHQRIRLEVVRVLTMVLLSRVASSTIGP